MASTIVLHREEIRKLLTSRSHPVIRHLEFYGRKARSNARRKAPVNTGHLRQSIGMNTSVRGTRIFVRIGTDVRSKGAPYGLYQELGTGIYGPRKTPITPKKRQFLKFKPKGSDTFVYARSVKGSRGHHYLVRGLQEAVPFWPIRVERF